MEILTIEIDTPEHAEEIKKKSTKKSLCKKSLFLKIFN